MPNIKPVSDLRSYNNVLKDIEIGEPVFLTKNGRGKYVILHIKEYEKNQDKIKLLSELMESENVITTEVKKISKEQIKRYKSF